MKKKAKLFVVALVAGMVVSPAAFSDSIRHSTSQESRLGEQRRSHMGSMASAHCDGPGIKSVRSEASTPQAKAWTPARVTAGSAE